MAQIEANNFELHLFMYRSSISCFIAVSSSRLARSCIFTSKEPSAAPFASAPGVRVFRTAAWATQKHTLHRAMTPHSPVRDQGDPDRELATADRQLGVGRGMRNGNRSKPGLYQPNCSCIGGQGRPPSPLASTARAPQRRARGSNRRALVHGP